MLSIKKNKRRKKINYDKITTNRFIVLIVFTVILFIIVGIKITNVMVFENKEYKTSLNNLTFTKVSGTSSPRGRIYDRNYNIIVDNKSLKTIIYKKEKGISKKDMIKVAEKLVDHLELDYSKLTIRMKREYLCAKDPDYCYKLVTKKEKDKVEQKKMTTTELYEIELERVPEEKLSFDDFNNKVF